VRATKIRGRKRKWIRHNAGWCRRSSGICTLFLRRVSAKGYTFPCNSACAPAHAHTHTRVNTYVRRTALASQMHTNAMHKINALPYIHVRMKHCRPTGCPLNNEQRERKIANCFYVSRNINNYLTVQIKWLCQKIKHFQVNF